MPRAQAAVLAVVMLIAGATAGWVARGRVDQAQLQRTREAAAEAEPEPPDPAETAVQTHDDELRQILADPQARALAARVRNASLGNGECEIEVDTAVGWFRVGCGAGDTPSVGDKFEVFGKLSPTGQIDGAPPLLRPSWLEPVGTIARLRGQ